MEGRVAVLTGASGGIGSAIAMALGGMKMRVLLAGRSEERLAQAEKAVRAAGGEAHTIAGNLRDTSFARDVIACAAERFGAVDVLVNCAGVAQHTAFANVTENEFDDIMTLNVKAPYFLTQCALPYLEASDCATVINICSVTAHLGYPEQSVYTASKHAMLGWSKSLASEYYNKGIRVHTVSPGGVYTDMIALARPDLVPDEMIRPEDIADIVRFFLTHRRTNAVVDEVCVHRANKEPFQY